MFGTHLLYCNVPEPWRRVILNWQLKRRNTLKISKESSGNLSRARKNVNGGPPSGLPRLNIPSPTKMTGLTLVDSGLGIFLSRPKYFSQYYKVYFLKVSN